jgi:hypothetical protein
MRAMILVALALAGCDAAADPAGGGSPDQKTSAIQARMHARFAASRRMEQAIALGDLDRAREEARTIAQIEEPNLLPAWRPYFENIRSAAHQVDMSKDLVAAAKMTAVLGDNCAKCHAANNAKLVFPKEPAPKDDPHLAARMASHQWAATQLWEGLIGPSDDRWVDGARLLAKAPLNVTAESDRLGIADDVSRVRLYANRALAAKPGDRALIYGDLLATCAHCHYAIRDVRPRTPGMN